MAISRQPASSNSKVPLLKRPTTMQGLVGWLTTVDHKRIAVLYFITLLGFFLIAGVEALIIRLQLAAPNQQLVNPDTYNQLFTMHGTAMIFLAVMPMGTAFANLIMPIMIGARDVAFPRLNAFSYWTYLAGGLILHASFFMGGAPDGGWFGYSPMTSSQFNPGTGIDFWVVGLLVGGIATLLSGINFIVTIVNMRAPGMTMMRMPVFVWMVLVTSVLIVFAFPPLTIGLLELLMDRMAGTYFFDPQGGGLPVLWQHIFWVFGHPEVYIMIMPAFGIISEVIPTFSRKPLFGYPLVVLSGIFIGFMGFAVWSHHMFTTGLGPVANTAFSLTTMTIAIPTGVKIFNWLGTMWGGKIRLTLPMIFAVAFIVQFTFGGISGMMHSVPPADAQQQDTYFIVAHFHYVLFGGALFAFLAGFYYWFPKMTGRMLNETMGHWIFWTLFVGFNFTFFPMHFLGLSGMPRRIQTYDAGLGFDALNLFITLSAFLIAISISLLIISVLRDMRYGKPAGSDPWDGRTLEWTIPSPMPYYNFSRLPIMHSLDQFWYQKYPDGAHGAADAQAQDYYAEEEFHMPGQSWYPLTTSAGLFLMGFGVIYNIPMAIFGLAVVLISVYAWAFEGVGGYHLKPEELEKAL